MGRELLRDYPATEKIVRQLDGVLQAIPDAPNWSLLTKLKPRSTEHMRLPKLSQPLVTALQLPHLAVLKEWGIEPALAVGHLSGEIAAAVAAGLISPEDGI